MSRGEDPVTMSWRMAPIETITDTAYLASGNHKISIRVEHTRGKMEESRLSDSHGSLSSESVSDESGGERSDNLSDLNDRREHLHNIEISRRGRSVRAITLFKKSVGGGRCGLTACCPDETS